MFTDVVKKDEYSKVVCDNCGEELPSWDPLEPHVFCPMCKLKAEQISNNARRELTMFGDMRRKTREKKQRDEEAQRAQNATVKHK